MCSKFSTQLYLVLFAFAGSAGFAKADDPVVVGHDRETTLDGWVEMLGSDVFLLREQAKRELTQAGQAAIEPLAQAADGSNLEIASNSVRLLLEMGHGHDEALSLQALERIARLEHRPVERARAEAILLAARERQAIATLKRLGAVSQGLNQGDRRNMALRLHLGNRWRGADQGMRYVGQLPGLETLTIHGVPITDRGLTHLHQLKNLNYVQLYGTEVTLQGVAALRKALPDAQIMYRRGALLGVLGEMDIAGRGAVIREVMPGTAAARANIRPGDLVTKYNGQRIKNFSGLTNHIAQCKPGDQATLEVERAGKTLTCKIEFGAWE